MTARERNERNLELAQTYTESHPESADLINAFLKMKDHPAEIKIAIGKMQSEACFASYLISNLAFPNIKFSEENGNPLILIGNHRENIASIPVAQCEILNHSHIDFGKSLNAEQDTFVVRLFNLDYQIYMNYKNRYIS